MTGTELRRIRKRLGLTQREMAERLGLHPNTLARQERGESGIGNAAARLAKLLDELHGRPRRTGAPRRPRRG
jgi:transcriptional regulator with XRE-family HTH domain